jgi:hypothetical protein
MPVVAVSRAVASLFERHRDGTVRVSGFPEFINETDQRHLLRIFDECSIDCPEAVGGPATPVAAHRDFGSLPSHQSSSDHCSLKQGHSLTSDV